MNSYQLNLDEDLTKEEVNTFITCLARSGYSVEICDVEGYTKVIIIHTNEELKQ